MYNIGDRRMKHNRTDAFISLRPLAIWTSAGTVITWKDSKQTQPSQSAIDAEITRLASDTSKDYIPKRIKAYPTVQEQLDLQYWDQVNGTTKWKEAVAKVKSDNPKP